MIDTAARSVIPTVAAMSLTRAVGLAAMHWRTCAWFVTNRHRWSGFPVVDFMNPTTIVCVAERVTLLEGC